MSATKFDNKERVGEIEGDWRWIESHLHVRCTSVKTSVRDGGGEENEGEITKDRQEQYGGS